MFIGSDETNKNTFDKILHAVSGNLKQPLLLDKTAIATPGNRPIISSIIIVLSASNTKFLKIKLFADYLSSRSAMKWHIVIKLKFMDFQKKYIKIP